MGHLPWYISLNLLLLGFAIGTYFKRRRRSQSDSANPPIPVATCPCSHTIGEHLNGGICQADVRRPYYLQYGGRNGHKWVRCACTKYWGPQPVTEFFHPGTHFLPGSTDTQVWGGAGGREKVDDSGAH